MQSDLVVKGFTAQDCAITLVAADLNPVMINPDILRYSGVIPAHWEPASQPVYTPQNVRLAFKNGVNILAAGHQVTFAEPMEIDSQIVAIAQQFVRAFPNLQYKGSTLNIRGYLPTDALPGRYIRDTWLAEGPWQDDCARAALNLVYKSDHAPLELALTEAMLQTKEENSLSIVLFNGRYSYSVKGDTAEERCRDLSSYFEHVRPDVKHYLNIVRTKFAKSAVGMQADVQKQFALSAAG